MNLQIVIQASVTHVLQIGRFVLEFLVLELEFTRLGGQFFCRFDKVEHPRRHVGRGFKLGFVCSEIDGEILPLSGG